MALDLVVSGATGRMGQALGRLIRSADDIRLLGGIARHRPDLPDSPYPEIVTLDGAEEIIRRADALIDFSAPEQLARLLDHHGDAIAGRALIVGTTGLDDHMEASLDRAAATSAVLTAANFSPGVNLLIALVERAAAALTPGDFDIEIVEAHHGAKADAPSGTALALGHAAAAARGVALDDVRRDGRVGRTGPRAAGEIGLHALRGGGVAGEHIVHFLGPRERIAFSHQALDRDVFADGALAAARWAVERGPGRYGMRDVLGL